MIFSLFILHFNPSLFFRFQHSLSLFTFCFYSSFSFHFLFFTLSFSKPTFTFCFTFTLIHELSSCHLVNHHAFAFASPFPFSLLTSPFALWLNELSSCHLKLIMHLRCMLIYSLSPFHFHFSLFTFTFNFTVY